MGAVRSVYAMMAVVAAAVAGLFAIAAPASADWGATTKVSGSSFVGTAVPIAAGMADDGAAAVAYLDSSDLYVASRESAGGAWTRTLIWPDANNSHDLVLDMNPAGDAVIAYRLGDGNGFVGVAYKPAEGSWGANAFLDNATRGSTASGRLDAAINSSGTAIVAWSATALGSPPQGQIRTVIRSKAGPWPALNGYQTAFTEDLNTGGSGTSLACASGPATAIDDTGRAIIAWADAYGSFDAQFTQPYVCGIRTKGWNGSAWSATNAVTPRPAVGYQSSSTIDAPSVGKLAMSSDPASGKLTLGFVYNPDSYDDTNDRYFTTGWGTQIYGGTVSASPIGSIQTAALSSIQSIAVDASGDHAVAMTTETDGVPITPAYATRTGSGASGSPFALTPLGTTNLLDPAVAASSSGRRFFIYREDVNPSFQSVASTAPSGGAICAPVTVLSPSTAKPAIATSASGNAIAAAGNSTGLFTAEYGATSSGCTGVDPDPVCPAPKIGTYPDCVDPPVEQCVAPKVGTFPDCVDPAPSNSVKVKSSKSLPNGKVKVTLSVPGAGKVKLTGTARLAIKKGVKPGTKKVTSRSGTVRAAGTVSYELTPNSLAKKAIKKSGKLKANLKVIFTPTGGTPGTASSTISFKKPRK